MQGISLLLHLGGWCASFRDKMASHVVKLCRKAVTASAISRSRLLIRPTAAAAARRHFSNGDNPVKDVENEAGSK